MLQLWVLGLNTLLNMKEAGYCSVSPSCHILPNSWRETPNVPGMLGNYSLHNWDNCGERQQLILKDAAILDNSILNYSYSFTLVNMGSREQQDSKYFYLWMQPFLVHQNVKRSLYPEVQAQPTHPLRKIR